MDLNLLNLFIAVAETSSFSGAARKLGLPKSSVSRGVASLEASLGTQLLHRTTRKVALSTAGAALYERSAPLLSSLREAVGSLPEREEKPSGELKLTAPSDLGATFLPEVIARFTARYPGIRVDLRLSSRVVDLVAEGFDLALRATAGRLADSTLVVRKLAVFESQLFASPLYLARRGTPKSLEDLESHDWVGFHSIKVPELAKAQAHPVIATDDMNFVREVIKQGTGIGLLPTYLAQADVTSGQLVRVVPRFLFSSSTLMMVWPKTQHVPRKVTAFRDFLLEYVAARPFTPGSA